MKTDSRAGQAELVCQLPEDSRIKLIGLGGIGCIVLEYLAIFLRSLDRVVRVVLIDGDRFEAGNGQRMKFGVMGNKAEVKAAETATWLGPGPITLVPVPQYLSAENIDQLIKAKDLVFLCVDNHPTRKLVSDHCATLEEVVLFSGGNEGVEPPRERGTYGNVQVHIRTGGRDGTASLTQYHPEIAHPRGKMPTDPDCAQLAQSSPQILFTNLAVASAMLNVFFAYTCGQLGYQEVKLDILEGRMLPQLPIEPVKRPAS